MELKEGTQPGPVQSWVSEFKERSDLALVFSCVSWCQTPKLGNAEDPAGRQIWPGSGKHSCC